jgi:hypothetical protein
MTFVESYRSTRGPITVFFSSIACDYIHGWSREVCVKFQSCTAQCRHQTYKLNTVYDSDNVDKHISLLQITPFQLFKYRRRPVCQTMLKVLYISEYIPFLFFLSELIMTQFISLHLVSNKHECIFAYHCASMCGSRTWESTTDISETVIKFGVIFS